MKDRSVIYSYNTADPKSYGYIRPIRDQLKMNPTESEAIIWQLLRNKQTGYKIRRQHIIEDFIVDFVCLDRKLVIEIDGKIHLETNEYDKERILRLRELCYDVIRFTNEEVIGNAEEVSLQIKAKLDSVNLHLLSSSKEEDE